MTESNSSIPWEIEEIGNENSVKMRIAWDLLQLEINKAALTVLITQTALIS